MASLEWNKLNKDIDLLDTKKKYFQKYYTSIKYILKGGRLITPPGLEYSIADALAHRQQEEHRVYNYGGSWRSYIRPALEADVDQLEAFRLVKNNRTNMFFRVEEPYITMYAETEQELYNLATTDLGYWADKIVSVTRPASAQHKELLDKGAIIMKTDVKYRYKVIFREGKTQNKAALCNYLLTLGDNVKVSNSVWRNLKNEHSWLWGVWFYINDPDLLTMFNIIEPGIVSNIHEVAII